MKPGSPKGQPKVKWTESEWQAVALALLKTHAEFIDHPHPVIDPDDLRAAMTLALPPARHRPIPGIGGPGCSHFRPGLLKAYEVIRQTLASNGSSIDPELAALADLTLPPGVAARPATEPPAPVNFRNKKRVKWSPAEFVLLARYLRRRYPGASYLESSTCVGLALTDIRDAMLAVLPPERHRPLHTITPLRPFFVSAFKAAKAEEYREKERIAREKAAAERAALVQPVQAEPPAPSAPVAVLNPYEAVFAPMLKPFINLLASELLAQLAPHIGQMVSAALVAATAPQDERQNNDQDERQDEGQNDQQQEPPRATVAHLPTRQHPASAPAPKKLLIGVVGPLPIQAQELARTFPALHIVALDGTNTNEAIARLRNAHRVIGMTSFMNHSMDGALAKNFADRYTRVTGGVSSIKRQIKIWDASGVLAA